MASPPTPARLGFLAIYNPSLTPSPDDHILYYASPAALATRRRARRRRRRAAQRGRPTEDLSPEERNERLRQIGLAQGMVEFAGGFASGAAVDVVETERSRVVVKEVESGWWVLASVDLTRVPLPPKLPTSAPAQPEAVEYSSRDVKPTALLLADLLRAHALFLLHHGPSLSSLLPALGRRRFVSLLTRYWDLFLSTWSVGMHGNPARSVFGGINVAASGELGVGVGEEERGSGEREVLEGLVGRVGGLVDVVVSRFAEGDEGRDGAWMGAGRDPGAEDGAVFLGVGALARSSLTELAHWVEDLYMWGDNAYGVIGAPSHAAEDSKGKKPERGGSGAEPQARDPKTSEGPAKQDKPIYDAPTADEGAAKVPPTEPGDARSADPEQPEAPSESTSQEAPPQDEGSMDKFVNILKLGYGTYWSLGGNDTPPPPPDEETRRRVTKRPAGESEGYFLLGLKGTVEEDPSDSEDSSAPPPTQTRTLHVRLSGDDETTPLRAVVYVIKPFILTFLFHPDTPSLSSDTLYRSLHYQLSPLRRSLLLSTSYRPPRPEGPAAMYDLIFDPETNTTHSSIPNIPVGGSVEWTRAEAAAAHAHLLALYAARKPRDVETTARTNKGWWVVWSRAPPESHPPIAEEESDGGGESGGKEVLLLRRAGESRARAFSGSALDGRLGQGMGVDTRGYIEGLLRLR